jgi:hypothetical protein
MLLWNSCGNGSRSADADPTRPRAAATTAAAAVNRRRCILSQPTRSAVPVRRNQVRRKRNIPLRRGCIKTRPCTSGFVRTTRSSCIFFGGMVRVRRGAPLCRQGVWGTNSALRREAGFVARPRRRSRTRSVGSEVAVDGSVAPKTESSCRRSPKALLTYLDPALREVLDAGAAAAFPRRPPGNKRRVPVAGGGDGENG